jgi:hypothetical protein
MAYSCSDFTNDVLNHLFDNNLIDARLIDSDDLQKQKTATIAAINNLIEGAAAPVPAAESNTAANTANDNTPASRFMAELLAENETLTAIADSHGNRTLADCMYLLSALQKGTHIEVHDPSESHIVAILEGLPSWAEWMTYVHEVTK